MAQKIVQVNGRLVVPVEEFEAQNGADVAQFFAGVPGLRKAWLVRKRVQHLPELPHLVLGFTATPWYLPRTAKRIRQTQDSIAEGVVFPGPAGVIGVEGGNAAIRRKMQKVAGGRLL